MIGLSYFRQKFGKIFRNSEIFLEVKLFGTHVSEFLISALDQREVALVLIRTDEEIIR